MVPFDDKSPFVTSGIRIGTSAITTRGFKTNKMSVIVELIDHVIRNHENNLELDNVAFKVNSLMKGRKLFNF